MKKAFCMLAILVICLSGGSGIPFVSAEETATDEYAAAFSGSARLTLVSYMPVELPSEMTDPDAGPGISPDEFLGLSPDGKAILVGAFEENEEIVEFQTGETSEPTPEPTPEPEAEAKNDTPGRNRKKSENSQTKTVKIPISHIGVIRDGKFTEFRANAARGDGDPFDKLDQLMTFYRDLPAEEEISWSADGRYATISNLKHAMLVNKSIDVPTVDMAGGEFWLADSYHNNSLAEDGGLVFISKFSRAGDYIYYLAYHNRAYQFCRCTPEGGNREVLYEQKRDDYQRFSLSSTSNLFEAADGSWILSGRMGDGRGNFDGTALIAFSPSGDQWTAMVIPTLIPKAIDVVRFSYSDCSGYGILTMLNQNVQSRSVYEHPEQNERSLAMMELFYRINLMRINIKDGFSREVWCLQRSGENNTDLKMAPASEYLQYLQAAVLGALPDEYPEGFDVRESIIHPIPIIMNACLSPDGRYALLCVNTREQDENHRTICCMYLLEMETMEIRPVEAPEGTVSETLWTNTMRGREYRPGMSWNPDGTIVLINGNGRIEFFRLTAEN